MGYLDILVSSLMVDDGDAICKYDIAGLAENGLGQERKQ